MLTYTSRRNLFGTLTGDSSAANLTIGDTLLAEADREIITLKPWYFRNATKTISTVASQQSYNLPANCQSVNNVTVTIGTTQYTPPIVLTQEEWSQINQTTAYSSDIPEAVFVFANTISFWPKPTSSTTNAITVNFLVGQKDLSVADYTTGSIVTATTDSTSITGTGTTWTSQMAGRYIRITDSNNTNTGDGRWYNIASVTSTTVLVLSSPYIGSSISAGSAAYTIGQTSIIPEEFQMVPVHRAVEQYFTFIQPEEKRAALAKANFAEGMKRMNINAGSTTI